MIRKILNTYQVYDQKGHMVALYKTKAEAEAKAYEILMGEKKTG
jgi:hypothetical protein